MEQIFFISSKIVQFFIEPLNLLFLISGLALFFLILRKPIASKRFLWLSVIGFILVGYAPIPESLARILENSVEKVDVKTIPSEQVAGIIILGGAISGEDIAIDRGEVSIYSAAERVTKGPELIRRYPNLPFIFSGFSERVTPRGMSEADTFKQLIAEQGLAEITQSTAYYENQSRNTYENAVYSKKMIDQLGVGNPSIKTGPWLLVTSATHMPRSVKIFEKQGIKIIPIPVDYQTSYTLQWREFNITDGAVLWNRLLYEYIGIVAYMLTGKI
jgi:uncharacterized SAM-binding protein YcdF (DUF218 family)